MNHIVDALAAALYVDDAELFATFLSWTADVLEVRSVPARSVEVALDLAARELRDFPGPSASSRPDTPPSRHGPSAWRTARNPRTARDPRIFPRFRSREPRGSAPGDDKRGTGGYGSAGPRVCPPRR
ncbi:hypothetical protein NKH77_54400 [Streptomyces sp. M19]